jgi:hypothetical protein
MAKIEVKLDRLVSERLHAYGGAVDICNGTADTRMLADELKFAALFYQHIIVPDGFFHCHGPIFDGAMAKNNFSALIRELLANGIIVPTIRNGDSIFANWNAGQHGVYPGKFMIVDRSAKASSILRSFDSVSTHFALWPPAMDDARETRYAQQLQIALTERMELRSRILDGFAPDTDMPTFEAWISARNRLFEKVVSLCEENRQNTEFRRGLVEQTISKETGLAEMRSYDTLLRRRRSDLKFRAATVALNIASTIYEANHASFLRTAASLFPDHTRWVTTRAFYSRLGTPDRLAIQKEIIKTGSFDVSRLRGADIVKFRHEAQDENGNLYFERYLHHLRNLHQPANGNTFIDANAEFVKFLVDEYVPAIARHFRPRWWIQAAIDVAIGGVAPLLVHYAGPGAEYFELGRHVLGVFVGHWVGHFAKSADSAELGEAAAENFTKLNLNRYTEWRDAS